MRKFYLFTFLFSIALFISSNSTFSQTADGTSKAPTAISDTTVITGEVGKIFTKAEADSLYGPVLIADTIKTEELAKLTTASPKYMLFNLIEGKSFVLNDSRAVLLSNALIVGKALTVSPTQAFRVWSTSKVQELIKQGGSDVTTVETRAKALTLTNGATVLEESAICPPLCH